MPITVRFRFNKLTGEVERFIVDDHDQQLPEHVHDSIAAEIGRSVAGNPQIVEVVAPPSPERETQPEEPEPPTEEERERDRS